ncbi:hypothetical protein [Nereida sp. MMG025]|uniref:hypothetical protein n=1 Tax=Nereida sp. MMG025 TaxID=2909981 RepID=UPI001F3FAD17|nr:hypothetical protein [Nereida sp. MMG025]MCF6444024.1 hypothetical protein [Nereida sp. MMG025]
MDSNKLEIARKGFEQTVLYFQAQNEIATSADQRGMSFTGFAAVIASVLISSNQIVPLPALNFLGAIVVIVGAVIVATSCQPRSFYIAGNGFSNWKDSLKENEDLLNVLIDHAETNEMRMDANDAILAQNGNLFRQGMQVVLGSTFITALGQVMALAHATL